MKQKRQAQTATSTRLQVTETPKMLHDLDKFVFVVAGHAAKYLLLIGIGGMFAFLAFYFENVAIYALALPFVLPGIGGLIFMINQLRNYKETTKRETTETTEETPIEQPKRHVPYSSPSKTDYIPLKRNDVVLTTESGEDFEFTGRNIDKLYLWLRKYGTAIRKTSNDLGPGFNELPDPIHAERYTAATSALKKHDFIVGRGGGYCWSNNGMQWLEKAGL